MHFCQLVFFELIISFVFLLPAEAAELLLLRLITNNFIFFSRRAIKARLAFFFASQRHSEISVFQTQVRDIQAFKLRNQEFETF